MVAKRHHYLPQCYLKGFSKPKQRGKVYAVQVYDRNGKSFNTNIINVANKRDFNRVEIAGRPRDAFEQDVAKFESELAPALARIVDARSLANEADKVLLINLIAAISIRTPRRRESIRNFHEDVAYMMLELATKTPERWEQQKRQMARAGVILSEDAPYNIFRKSILDRSFRLELANEWHIRLELHGLDAVLPTLQARKWMIMIAPSVSEGFVTCDNPVALMFNDPAMRGGFYGPGHGLAGTELIFPICNRIAIAGTFEGMNMTRIVTEETVAHVNGAMVAYCHRQVYGRNTEFKYQLEAGKPTRRGASLPKDIHFLNEAGRPEGEQKL